MRVVALSLLLFACTHDRPAPRAETSPTAATDPDPTLGPNLEHRIAQRFATSGLLGLAVGVVMDGRVLVEQGYGFTDLDRKTPITIDTEFAIGSLTKQFTAAAVMQLVEAGKIGLDEPIGRYVPSVTQPVTIRQLLAHQSGLPDYATGDAVGKSQDELLARIAALMPTFAPGTRFEYSNTNYFLLARAVEAASGQSYEAYLRAHVFSAAGLTATRVCTWPAGAQATLAGDDGPVHVEPWDFSLYDGAGALCSTVRDLLRWQDALFAGKVVGAKSLAFMTTPAVSSEGPTQYGAGLMIGALGTHRLVNHAGAVTGSFESEVSAYPDDHLVIVLLTNTYHEPAMSTLPLFDVRIALAALAPVPKDLPVDAALRAAVTGTYTSKLGTFEVVVEGDQLHLHSADGTDGRMLYQGDDAFVFEPDRAAAYRFEISDGRATALDVLVLGKVSLAAPRSD